MTFHPNLAAMRQDDLAGNGQPQANASACPPAPGFVHLKEAFKDARLILRRNAAASIRYANQYPAIRGLGRAGYTAAGRGKL